MMIQCPQCTEEHIIEVCDECGWPPALDGHCVCPWRTWEDLREDDPGEDG